MKRRMIVAWSDVADEIAKLGTIDVQGVPHVDLLELQQLVNALVHPADDHQRHMDLATGARRALAREPEVDNVTYLDRIEVPAEETDDEEPAGPDVAPEVLDPDAPCAKCGHAPHPFNACGVPDKRGNSCTCRGPGIDDLPEPPPFSHNEPGRLTRAAPPSG